MASSRTYSSFYDHRSKQGTLAPFVVVFPWCSAVKKQRKDNCAEENWCSIWSGICVGRRGSAF